MSFEVGEWVWRNGAFGPEQGQVTGRVGQHNAWYVTVGPGQTYMCQEHDLRRVVIDIQTLLRNASASPSLAADGRPADLL